MDKISKKVFDLARKLHDKLLRLHHSNGKPMAVIYRDTDYTDVNIQGGVVNFNLCRSNGEYIGYLEVLWLYKKNNKDRAYEKNILKL